MNLNIAQSVQKNLEQDKHLLAVVAAFSKHFRTNYGRTEDDQTLGHYGVLYLRPERELELEFALTREVLCLAFDPLAKFDNRALTIIDEILAKEATRLVDDSVFVITDAPNAQALCEEYMERRHRKVIRCAWRDIEAAHDDFSRELFRQFLYSRNFFDVTDPVSTDAQFFARYQLVDEVFDTLGSGQSVGVFGLRKIGKTSVLDRIIKKNHSTNRFRIAKLDAQGPEIYANNAAGVALEVCRAFNSAWAAAHGSPLVRNIPTDLNLVAATRFFRDFIQQLMAQGKPLVLIIDELERILPSATKVTNWNTDYIDLWRLLRSETQTRSGKFTFLVAATNPYFVEASQFGGEDNPLYRFIRPIYLPMFKLTDLSEMLQKLGKSMGISFQTNALEEIHRYFGGHPLLSRQVCSAIAKDLPQRPLSVDSRHVRRTLERQEGLFNGDMDAILKVFDDYYPGEFSLLKSLANDEKRGVRLLDESPNETRHLTGYGLLNRTKNSFKFTMTALPAYLQAVPNINAIRPAEVPSKTSERHVKLQSAMNNIEPALRNLVFFQFKTSFGNAWQEKLFEYLQDGTKSKLESRGKLTSQELLEETLLSEVLAAISGNWSLFAKVFGNRDDLRRHMRVLNDVARSAADHRKFAICENDGKYFPAMEACVFFEEKLLN